MTNHGSSSDITFDTHLASLFQASHTIADKQSILTSLKGDLVAETVVIDGERTQLASHSAKVSTVLSSLDVVAEYINPQVGLNTTAIAALGGGGTPTYVLYNTSEEEAGNGLTLSANNSIEVPNSFNNGAQLYVCRFNQNHTKFKLYVLGGYILNPYMKWVIFNTLITDKTTATGRLVKIQNDDDTLAKNEDELSKGFVVHCAVNYRNPATTDHMDSYLHVVVSSNKHPSGDALSLTEANNEDTIRDYIRNDKDDQAWDWADGSHSSANEGTFFGLYISLTHNNI